MRAYKCDRCGVYFDKDTSEKDGYLYVYRYYLTHTADRIHLCNGCLNLLNDWFIMKRSTEKSCDTCKYEYLAISKQPCRGCKTESNWEAKE